MNKDDKRIWEQIGKDISHGVKNALNDVDWQKLQNKLENWPKKKPTQKPMRTKNGWLEYESTNQLKSLALKTDRQGNPIAPFKGKAGFYQVVGYFAGVPLFLTTVYNTLQMLNSVSVLNSGSGSGAMSYLFFNLLLLYPATYFAARIGYKGWRLSGARERFGLYWEGLKTKGFATMQDLSNKTGRSIRKVRKEIQFMVKEGFFDYGKFDRDYDTIIINEPNFLAHQKAAAIENQKKAELEQMKAISANEPKAEIGTPKVVLQEGRDYIEQLRFAREGIRTEQMAQDLLRLEKITGNIFELVSSNPEKIPKIRRFMQYYLPSTVKFAKAYDVMEDQSVQGDNIIATRRKIEDSMQLIIQAFEQLHDELFQKEALDIHSDLIAMETMLAHDGLGGKDFIRIKQLEEERNEDGQQHVSGT